MAMLQRSSQLPSFNPDTALLVAGLGKSFQTIALLWLYFSKK